MCFVHGTAPSLWAMDDGLSPIETRLNVKARFGVLLEKNGKRSWTIRKSKWAHEDVIRHYKRAFTGLFVVNVVNGNKGEKFRFRVGLDGIKSDWRRRSRRRRSNRDGWNKKGDEI